MLAFIIFVILAIIISAKAMKIVREDERLAIFRLGRFLKVAGPGLVVLVPLVDKSVKVNLPEKVPGWQGLSWAELDEKIKSIVLQTPFQ